MDKATLDPVWVPNDKLPCQFVITNVREQTMPTKRGPYKFYVLTLDDIYEYDAKFGDKNFLINTIDPDPSKWIEKIVKMKIGENKYKVLF